MSSVFHNLQYVLVAANTLCLAGFYYGKLIYNKKVNSLKIHYFSITLIIFFLIYLLLCLFSAVYFAVNGIYLYSLISSAAFINPFIIGKFANNYLKASFYYNLQTIFFLLSLSFFILIL